jgi:Amt family ammonium transporter
MLFVAYQGTFAIITPALISGAFAERMRFSAVALFMLLWSTLIYSPLAHWVWGGGWIATRIGALDFAGGTVVHIASGVSALVTALFVGKRVGYGHDSMPPHNLPFTVVGASLLWVGRFGFNAGSALGSNELASVAFVNTNSAAAAAALGWIAAEWLRTGKPTLLGLASGAVAGLVVVTPAAGFVTPIAAIVMGVLGGVVCQAAVSLKPRLGYDDALDVVGVHMVGGTLGALCTGVFATSEVNSAVTTLSLGLGGGLLRGHPVLLGKQALAVLITLAFCGAGTWLILLLVNSLVRVRAEHEEEIAGLDLSQHSERAYSLGEAEQVAPIPAEPRAALAPPSGERFVVRLDGIEPEALIKYWRSLCQVHQGPVSPQFRAVYGLVTTVSGTRFRFRGGDREAVRQSLEELFRSVSPRVTAKFEA